jgi:hypothetical protein
VLLSDDAGQFAVGKHALCWVHAERVADDFATRGWPVGQFGPRNALMDPIDEVSQAA